MPPTRNPEDPHTFRRLVRTYRGDFNMRTFRCLDQFLCMAFAQLTYRERLRDIEACLGAQPSKLYHLGVRRNVTRSNPGRRQRSAGLAHPLRVRSGPDPHGATTVCARVVGRGLGEHGLCPGLHHHRPVLVAFSTGAFPPDQNGRQAAYAADDVYC